MAGIAAKVYGDAVYEAALEHDRIDKLWDDMAVLENLYDQVPKLLAILEEPRIGKKDKQSVVKILADACGFEQLAGLMEVMVWKSRQKELPDVIRYVRRRIKEYRKIGTAYVTSAFALPPKLQELVRARLLVDTDYEQLDIHYQVNPSLLGGLIIQIGDRVADGSIRTRIDTLRRELGASDRSESKLLRAVTL